MISVNETYINKCYQYGNMDTRKHIVVQKETHDRFMKTKGKTHDDKLSNLMGVTKETNSTDLIVIKKIDALTESVNDLRGAIERKTGY